MLGGKVRAVRRRARGRQVQLAERPGISASYLNFDRQAAGRYGSTAHQARRCDAPRSEGLLGRRRDTPSWSAARGLGDPLFDDTTSHPRRARTAAASPTVSRALLTLFEAYSTHGKPRASLVARSPQRSRPGPYPRLPSEESDELATWTALLRGPRRRSGSAPGQCPARPGEPLRRAGSLPHGSAWRHHVRLGERRCDLGSDPAFDPEQPTPSL